METDLNPCILLDRDGVINEAVRDGYVLSPDSIRLLPGSAAAIGELCIRGYRVLVISNQQCVGKEIISLEELSGVSTELNRLVKDESGGQIADYFYCPHLKDAGCTCRKPEPGLILHAQEQYGFTMPATYFVGDSGSDLEAAQRAGCRSIFVNSGLDAADVASFAEYIAEDLAGAVRYVLQQHLAPNA